MRTRNYRVTVQLPDDISTRDMADYIRTAIQMWRKGGDPETTLFNLPDSTFSVASIAKQVKLPGGTVVR